MCRWIVVLALLLVLVRGDTVNFELFITPWFPMTMCIPGTEQIINNGVYLASQQTEITPVWNGYEFHLVVDTLSSLRPDYSISLKCVNSTVLEQYLKFADSLPNQFTLGIGALRPTLERLSQFVPSTKTLESGLRLVVRRDKSSKFWNFIEPISWEVGLIYIGAVFGIALFIWIFEQRKWGQSWRRLVWDYVDILFDQFSSVFFANSITLTRISSKIVQWVFWFNILVLIVLYKADLVHKVSQTYNKNEITSLGQAQNMQKTIGMFSSFESFMQRNYPYDEDKYWSNYTFRMSTETLVQRMYNDLEEQYIDAIVLEEPLARYYTPLYCFSALTDEQLWQFNYVTFFSANVNNSFVTEYNRALDYMRESYKFRNMKKQIFDIKELATCVDNTEKLTLTELSGLWISLSGSFALALVLWGAKKLFKLDLKYVSPFYKPSTEKAKVFEEQLSKAVSYDTTKMLEIYKENIFYEIESLERTLMLQDLKDLSSFNQDSQSDINQEQMDRSQLDRSQLDQSARDQLKHN